MGRRERRSTKRKGEIALTVETEESVTPTVSNEERRARTMSTKTEKSATSSDQKSQRSSEFMSPKEQLEYAYSAQSEV